MKENNKYLFSKWIRIDKGCLGTVVIGGIILLILSICYAIVMLPIEARKGILPYVHAENDSLKEKIKDLEFELHDYVMNSVMSSCLKGGKTKSALSTH